MSGKISGPKPEPERDEEGRPKITLKYVQAWCEYNKGYYTPHLNDVLYLNMKGFTKVENLEEYYNCKALYMDGNNFKGIEGIGHMTDMVSLYLHDNIIDHILGIDGMHRLTTLTLSNNMITRIEGLESCVKLNKLDLCNNRLASFDAISALSHNSTSLRIFQVKNNNLPYDTDIVDFFAGVMNIAYLEMKGNPFQRDCPSYRKMMISKVNSLGYLDDKPVELEEKRLCKAWARGGREEEAVEREKLAEERQQWMKSMVNHARASREEALKTINKDYLTKELEKQTKYKSEIDETKRQLDNLRKEHIELKSSENDIKENEPNPQESIDGSDSENEQSSSSIKFNETIEEMEERYQKCLTDPNMTPLEKESLKQRLQTRKRNKQFGIDEETQLESNEFEQELLSDRLDQLQANLYASEAHYDDIVSQVPQTEEEENDRIIGVYGEYDEHGNKTKVIGTSKIAEKMRQDIAKERDDGEKAKLKKIMKDQKSKDKGEEEDQDDKFKLRWTTDLENSLENLLVSYKFNFNAATDAFNKYLEEKQKEKGIVIKKQEWSDLAKKWSEIQKRKQPNIADDTNSTIRNSEVPEELNSVTTWDELE